MRFAVKSPLEHDGKVYALGDFVELTEKQARAMPHAVEPAPEPAKKPSEQSSKPTK